MNFLKRLKWWDRKPAMASVHDVKPVVDAVIVQERKRKPCRPNKPLTQKTPPAFPHPCARNDIPLPVPTDLRKLVDEKYSLHIGTRGYTALDRDFGVDWGEEE